MSEVYEHLTTNQPQDLPSADSDASCVDSTAPYLRFLASIREDAERLKALVNLTESDFQRLNDAARQAAQIAPYLNAFNSISRWALPDQFTVSLLPQQAALGDKLNHIIADLSRHGGFDALRPAAAAMHSLGMQETIRAAASMYGTWEAGGLRSNLESLAKQTGQSAAMLSSLHQGMLQFSDSLLPLTRMARFLVDPLLVDVFRAEKGDTEAAKRLAIHIQWSPQAWLRKAIRIRARSLRRSPEEIRQEILTEGLLLALRGNGDRPLPIQIQPQSNWLYDGDQGLKTIRLGDLSLSLFWEWAQQEAVRAAVQWLTGYPYAPSVILTEPPSEHGELRLARFTPLLSDGPANRQVGGRPPGSSIFPDREAFLQQVRSAADHVRSRGNKITQQRVAEAMGHKGLLGKEDCCRQLRERTEEFCFSGWADLASYI